MLRAIAGPAVLPVMAVALFVAEAPSFASSPLKLTGSLAGAVRSAGGTPQMGALVLLYNKQERLVSRRLSDEHGQFEFKDLLPDLYTIRVTLASFVPAVRKNISVQPGMQSVLAINLASVLSSIEIISLVPLGSPLMSDDWRLVLRSASATRPVLRALEQRKSGDASPEEFWADTRGLFRVSSGEVTPFTPLGTQPDLGTAFAVATSLFGKNQLQFAGNLGYATAVGLPSAGFRTSFSRMAESGSGPQVKVTVQQINLPVRAGAPTSGQGDMPALRSMSATLIDRASPWDGLRIDYGTSFASVSFTDRLNYLSPFVRASYEMGSRGALIFGYSAGAPPIELLADSPEDPESGMQHDLAALSVLPRASLRDGHARVQRVQNLEATYELTLGTRRLGLSAYQENIQDGVLTLSGELFDSRNLLPELTSNNYSFNIGNYRRSGYAVTLAETLTERTMLTVAAGRGGVLRTEARQMESFELQEVRRHIRPAQQSWVMLRVTSTLPLTGTHVAAGYLWTDYRSLTPAHFYLTRRFQPDAGLNVRVRQPIPRGPWLPGRLEATAELRNLLAQGYLCLAAANGRPVVLTHSPRAVRGGVSFIF